MAITQGTGRDVRITATVKKAVTNKPAYLSPQITRDTTPAKVTVPVPKYTPTAATQGTPGLPVPSVVAPPPIPAMEPMRQTFANIGAALTGKSLPYALTGASPLQQSAASFVQSAFGGGGTPTGGLPPDMRPQPSPWHKGALPSNLLGSPFEQQDILRRANIRSEFGGQPYVQSSPFSIVPQKQARLTDVQRQTDLAIRGGVVTGRDAQGNIVYQGNQQFTRQAPNKMSDALRQFSGYSEYDLLNAGYLYDEKTGWWYLPGQGTQQPGSAAGAGAGGGVGGYGAGGYGGGDYGGGGYGGGSYGGGPFGGGNLTNWRIGL